MNFIQEFRSTDTNAPVLSGQVNAGNALLLACLVNGYATLTNAGLSQVGTLVTVNISAANATLRTNDYIKIAGVTPSGYNGTFQIAVVDNDTFTYNTTAGLGASSVHGTYNKAGLGWTQPFTGTNASIFQMGNSGGYFGSNSPNAGHIIEVQDNGAFAGGAKEMGVRGAVSTTGMGAWTNAYPSAAQQANGLCWFKSTTADATARTWALIGDDKGFYLMMEATNTNATAQLVYFGWYPTFKVGDLYNSMINGSATFNTAATSITGNMSLQSTQFVAPLNASAYTARNSSQTGGSVQINIFPLWSAGGSFAALGGTGTGSLTIPNGPDGAIWHLPLFITDGLATNFRGMMPGNYPPMHSAPFALYEDSSNIAGAPGVVARCLFLSHVAASGQTCIDVIGPW